MSHSKYYGKDLTYCEVLLEEFQIDLLEKSFNSLRIPYCKECSGKYWFSLSKQSIAGEDKTSMIFVVESELFKEIYDIISRLVKCNDKNKIRIGTVKHESLFKQHKLGDVVYYKGLFCSIIRGSGNITFDCRGCVFGKNGKEGGFYVQEEHLCTGDSCFLNLCAATRRYDSTNIFYLPLKMDYTEFKETFTFDFK